MADLLKAYAKRTIKCILGILLFGLGMHLTIRANIGLAPWDTFSTGLSNLTGLSFGLIVMLSGIIILGIVLLLKEKIGLGTLLNILLAGLFVDLLNAINIVPMNTTPFPRNLWLGIPMLLIGQWINCFATIFYITPGLGCGPKDSLMVALGKRFVKTPIGVIRACIEAMALLIGFLLGAPIGFGSALSVFGLGLLLQLTCKMTKVNLKAVDHESIFKTFRILMGKDQQPPVKGGGNGVCSDALHK